MALQASYQEYRSGFSSNGAESSVNQIASDLLAFQRSGGSLSGSYSAGSSSGAAFGGSASFGASSGSSGSYGASFGASSGSSGASFGGSSGLAGSNAVSYEVSASYGSSSGSSGASFGGASSGAVSFGGASGSSSSSSSSAVVLSQIEQAILRSDAPINISETEEITVNGQRGIWANRAEVINWRGVIPITEYVINEDANPEIITKRSQQKLTYVQELAIRYLRPPTPPAPGEIVITQELNTLTPPAPPLVIRQQPARSETPEPLVIREAPPQAPAAVGRKVITISGKRIPPPPRKVVIERLAPLPSKPQSVLVERWLPYSQVKRRVIFQRSNQRDAVAVKPRNVIVQWEAPQVEIKRETKFLGVVRANPVEYVQRYGASLKQARDLPPFVLEIKAPEGVVLAANSQQSSVFELEGDLQALRLVDLDREGLSEYRAFLSRLGISFVGAAGLAEALAQLNGGSSGASFGGSSNASFGGSSNASFGASTGSSSGVTLSGTSIVNAVNQIFSQIDVDQNGRISVEEAEKVLLRLNSRLNRRYGEDDRISFFQALDLNRDNSIDLEEFRRAFVRLL